MSSQHYLVFVIVCLFSNILSKEYRYFITTQGLNPTDTSFWLTPDHANHNGSLVFLGGIPNNLSHWYIAEWNTPQVISLTAHYPNETVTPCNYVFQSNSSKLLFWANSLNGLVCVYTNTQTGISEFELHLNGSNLDCGVEYDLFLSPVTEQWKNYPIGFIGSGSNAPYFNELSQLIFQFKLSMVKDYNIIFHCGTSLCGTDAQHLDYGYITIGLVLSNIKHRQTIFYQIQLFDTRDNLNCGTGGNACAKSSNWYFKDNPYGFNDNIPLFNGYSCLNYTNNKQISFKEDMLQRLCDVITTVSVNDNIQGLDHNISNWQLGSMYLGGGIMGMTALDIMVTNIDLVGILK